MKKMHFFRIQLTKRMPLLFLGGINMKDFKFVLNSHSGVIFQKDRDLILIDNAKTRKITIVDAKEKVIGYIGDHVVTDHAVYGIRRNIRYPILTDLDKHGWKAIKIDGNIMILAKKEYIATTFLYIDFATNKILHKFIAPQIRNPEDFCCVNGKIFIRNKHVLWYYDDISHSFIKYDMTLNSSKCIILSNSFIITEEKNGCLQILDENFNIKNTIDCKKVSYTGGEIYLADRSDHICVLESSGKTSKTEFPDFPIFYRPGFIVDDGGFCQFFDISRDLKHYYMNLAGDQKNMFNFCVWILKKCGMPADIRRLIMIDLVNSFFAAKKMNRPRNINNVRIGQSIAGISYENDPGGKSKNYLYFVYR